MNHGIVVIQTNAASWPAVRPRSLNTIATTWSGR